VARRLEPARNGSARNGVESTDGEVSMVLMLGNGSEVEVKLPGRFKVSPQIAGAIKAVTGGVVTVEAL
jgi:DNA polymerase-3 subunit alpha